MTAQILIPVGAGELLDKISILRLKADKISTPTVLANVRHELDKLLAVQADEVSMKAGLTVLYDELADVNGQLWQVEDDLRLLEKSLDFGSKFIDLARSVYQLNDRRAALKKQKNQLTKSDIIEEKSYS